jgi:branched-chain amino acid aminotransferase
MNNKYKDEFIWFKGKVMPYNEAQVNIMNTSTQYGINVFEGIRCYYNEEKNQLFAFKLYEHLERLLSSAKLLRLEVKPHITIDYLIKGIQDVIKANNLQEDIYVKIGIFIDDEGSWNAIGPTGIYIVAFPKGRVYDNKKGLSCCISSWQRINDSTVSPRIKSGANYINSRYGYLEAQMNGYDSTIFLNSNGKVSEGPGACIFMVRKGKLVTPSITSSILESITRQAVIEIARNELNIQVEERDVDRTELYVSDELFFVGTAIEIVPILSVDHHIVDSDIGSITSQLRSIFYNIVMNKVEKYNNWLVKI